MKDMEKTERDGGTRGREQDEQENKSGNEREL